MSKSAGIILDYVSDIIIIFKDGKCLKLSEEQIKALGEYGDVSYIKINGTVFGKEDNENN
jgi:hypothetical protein